MAIATVKVSDKGQIAIPLSIRESMRIRKGESLVLLQIDNKILLEKSQKAAEILQDEFKDILKFNEKSLKAIWGSKEDNTWNKYMKRGFLGKKR
jgi:AbrB family looped-hinge helix DNA binding protein